MRLGALLSTLSLGLNLLGALDEGSSGNMESLDASQSDLSGLLRDVGESLHNLGGSVNASLQSNNGSVELALRVLLYLGDLVVALVSLEEGNHSLGALLCLFLSGGETNRLSIGIAR